MYRMTPARAASLIATSAVIVGFAALPFGYYMLLRLFLCGVSLFLLTGANLVLREIGIDGFSGEWRFSTIHCCPSVLGIKCSGKSSISSPWRCSGL